eukprot:TRINITY_DN3018_c0_g1_i1.p1 TRINITY_DN3018_c0_g1~~TRINITY_DN3018_c0_g1_i1.p1  ORF type:complete len:117 (+),score=3.08 TRINITY_DN3018_c0_g1_i1:51-353(+)
MSFSRSSNNIRLNGSILSASCRNKKGGYHESCLDLDEYIGNKQGRIVWAGRNFSRSSEEIVLKFDHMLECKARDSNGKFHLNSIDLDERIGNVDGVLKYK